MWVSASSVLAARARCRPVFGAYDFGFAAPCRFYRVRVLQTQAGTRHFYAALGVITGVLLEEVFADTLTLKRFG